MTNRILLVDDDRNILEGYARILRKDFDLEVAQDGGAALKRLEDLGPFAVIVADMRMPGLSGLELLAQVRVQYPDLIRIMLTGNADQKTAMDAVNHGQVFRFLTKPCPPEELGLALRAGLRQHRLVLAEREVLEQTLTSAITLFSELLAGMDPVLFSRGQMVRQRSAQLARSLGCEEAWAVEVAALLAPLGRATLPEEARQASTGRPGADALFSAMPEVGAKLLEAIPRLEGVARMIRYHAKGYDGTGFPADEVQGEDLPLGSRILKVLWDFSELEQGLKSRVVALEAMRLRPKPYDPKVLVALGELIAHSRPAPGVQELQLSDLQTGMVLATDLLTGAGAMVLPRGLRLGPGHLELLKHLAQVLDLNRAVSVLQPEGATHES